MTSNISLTTNEMANKNDQGRTCRVQLCYDKALAYRGDPAAPKFGKTYYRVMRTTFQVTDGPANALDVRDENEEVDAVWVEAVTKSRSAVPMRERLNSILQTRGPCKQAELVGLLSHALELRPAEMGGQLRLLLNNIKYIIIIT